MSAPLGIHIDEVDGRHVLHLAGEMDIATAPAVLDAATSICDAGARDLLLDLRGIEFMDSSGLRSLLEVRTACQQAHCRFAISAVGPQVQRLLEISGVVDILPLDVAEAASAAD
jgi:anti-anti-sigma factor